MAKIKKPKFTISRSKEEIIDLLHNFYEKSVDTYTRNTLLLAERIIYLYAPIRITEEVEG